jgi:SHS2 domain-containing protein
VSAVTPDAGFELLEHTADLGIRAWGTTAPEAFGQAARALVEVMGIRVDAPGRRRVVKASAQDPAGVLVAFLNELIWFHETESVGFAAIDVIALSDSGLVAEVEAAPLPEAAVGIGVKAATYHQVRVERRPGVGVEVHVFLDV